MEKNKPMNFKILYILFVLIALPILSQAQHVATDIVEMKDGSIYKGVIIEQVPGESVKIEIANGSIVNLKSELIVKITKDFNNAIKWKKIKKAIVYKPNGLAFQLQAGFNLGGKQYSDYYYYTRSIPYSVKTAVGYQWHNLLVTSIGAGFENYNNKHSVPITLNVNGSLNKKISPLYFASAGYGFFLEDLSVVDLERQNEGGFHWNAGLGLKLNTSNKVSYQLTCGFQQQQLTRTDYYWNDWLSSFPSNTTKQKVSYNRIAVNLGVTF